MAIRSEVAVNNLKLVSDGTILSDPKDKISITLYANGDSDPIQVNITFIEVETISEVPINVRNTESSLDLIIEIKGRGSGALRKPFEFADNDTTGTSLYITFRASPVNEQMAFTYNIFESLKPANKRKKRNGKK